MLGALSAFGPLSTDMYLPGLPAMARDLHAGPSLAQLTISVCLIGLAAGQLTAGPLSDALGRRRPLLIGLAAYALASLGCALCPSVGPLLVLRLIQGLAGGAGIAIARAVVRDRSEGPAAAHAYAALMVVSGLGPILAPVVGGQLLHVTDWRGIFVTLALIGVLLAVSAALLVAESLPAPQRQTGGLRSVLTAMRILFADRRYVAHALAGAFALSAMMAYIAASPFVLERLHGVSAATYSLVFAANGIGILAGRQLATRLIDRRPPAAIMRVSISVQVAATLLVALDVFLGLGLGLLLVGFLFAVASNGATLPMATALAMADHPERAGSASGLVGFTQFLLASIVAPLVGVAGPRSAVPMAIAMPACATSALAALTLAG